ncbi:helix-turn-helix transcriptional regulator [Rhizobium gallicum]|uniref:helix-turn-helix transcriptional regulator n=1 Tax=Rhizobium gallicum TaxID=56730 RepID=UPI001EF7EFCD|nr:helix-turn-helix transcriptional regulator [Rhizobium gallicum]ULJ73324.1 helix-turn-helix transcriptional regulator [Rhizobium gallicum]
MFFKAHNVLMNKNELKNVMSALGLSPTSLAKLLDVTPRAISMWLTGERSIPGPAEAYLNLFSTLLPSQQELEIQKSEKEKLAMKDGLYQLEFSAHNGVGIGVLIFENGRIYGSDVGNGKWDGTYTMNPVTKQAELDIRVEMPAGEESVLGPAQRFSWNVDVKATMDPTKDVGVIIAQTNLGQAQAKYKYMRSLPE